MTEYELWLDESGNFLMEEQIDVRKNPSLIGGILIPRGALSDAKIHSLADPDHTGAFHAVEMSYAEAQRIVPAALKGVCDAGGRLVYFENAERIYYHNNRDLYLRALASGLAQLVRTLSIQGDFSLNIVVAVRFWLDEERLKQKVTHEITPEEYRQELKHYITHEFDDIHFSLSPHSRIALTILSGRHDARLELADYACNAKLVLNSYKYKPMRNKLLPLVESAYHFSITVPSAEASIHARLASGDVSGALVEYFTARGKMNRERMFQEIMERFSALSYRLQRLQVRSFASALRIAAGKETDFERSEALLKNAVSEFFGELESRGIDVQTDESLFTLNLALADMFLREGDVIHAAPIMAEMERLLRSMNYRVENLAFLYLYRDKKALYEINRMEYAQAVDTMEQTIQTMEGLISVLSADGLVLSYFGREDAMMSEYLGDAYCMKIYAELFLQRENRALYQETLRADTEKALRQYRYPGELERNQQYRAKAENEEGNCLDAMKWLLKTQEIGIDNGRTEDACLQYLIAARGEDHISRAYYLMYYIEIMENAARLGQTDVSDAMKAALDREKSSIRDFLTPEKEQVILSHAKDEPVIFTDIFSTDKKRAYHPLEIVLWKYGAYLWRSGAEHAAEKCWKLAVSVCDENPDYTVLKLVALAILLEWMAHLLRDERKTAAVERELIKRCEALTALDGLSEPMRAYVTEVQRFVLKDGQALSPDRAYALSRVISF